MNKWDFPIIGEDRHIEKITPGQDIIMTGFIALEGTARLAKEQWERLSCTLPAELLEDAIGFLNYMTRVPEAAGRGSDSASPADGEKRRNYDSTLGVGRVLRTGDAGEIA